MTNCHILGLEDLNYLYISFHLDQPDNFWLQIDLRTTIFRKQNHTDHCHSLTDYYFLIELLLAILKIVKNILFRVVQKVYIAYQLGTYLGPDHVQVNCS